MKIREIMTKNVCCASENDTLKAVASYMKQNDTGFIPVNNAEGNLSGIITDRDIVIRAVADNSELNTLRAADVMSRDIVTLSPDHSPIEASRLMSRAKVRRLPVTEKNKVVGVLSLGDLSRTEYLFSETAAALCEICEDN
ncbi:MAG: CBS domain-containing protein [Ruminococcaceae bacterium]|nr:CBS domain-containing protein [Oscillospiraceae bacterium]